MRWGDVDYKQLQKLRDNLQKLQDMDLDKFCEDVSKELAARLNVTPPSITSSIQKMERDGYLTRHPDPADQRVMRLTLTEKGKSCIKGVYTVAEQMEELMFRGMTREEILLFKRLLFQIRDNLDEK